MFTYVECYKILNKRLCNISTENLRKLFNNDWKILELDSQSLVDHWENIYSEPMGWIGIYIEIASLFCILAMAADLWHGFRSKKLWFPSKYFSLNAASIAVIIVAMKLPVDLSSEMPSYVDQAAKLTSLAFMCTMMANLMPSLASMDNKTLLANIVGLSILVITMIVNIGIQINTGVISPINYTHEFGIIVYCVYMARTYMAMILLLLILMISSSLTIPTAKVILESKYKAKNQIISFPHQSPQHSNMSMVEKLRQHVTRYWVMAETGSPQFVMASNPLSAGSGLISGVVFVLNFFVVLQAVGGYIHDRSSEAKVYGSVYKWSILFIVLTHSIGVVVGTIAPICRCFSVLSFKLVGVWMVLKGEKVLKVENYWTQMLFEWKESGIPFLSSNLRTRTLVYKSKNIILSFFIGFQWVIVVSCKLLVEYIKIYSSWFCYVKSFFARLFLPPMASNTEDINEELNNYALQTDDTMEFAEKTLKGITISINSFIVKAEKEQNNTLLTLLEKSTGFSGLQNFDTDSVRSLLSVEHVNSWSLPVVTLTCLALALPNIPGEQVKCLVKSVREGLSFTHLVEETLNTPSEYVNIRKATITLWNKVEIQYKWLEISLAKDAFKEKTSTQILKLFADKAEEIVTKITQNNGESVEHNAPTTKLIAANSMYRIAQTLLLRHQNNTAPIREEQLLFDLLSGMIADILCACFTNIPQVIRTKCQESVIEKREASVRVAAELLGKSRKIIERLEARELPTIDPDKLAFVDEWRHYLRQSIP